MSARSYGRTTIDIESGLSKVWLISFYHQAIFVNVCYIWLYILTRLAIHKRGQRTSCQQNTIILNSELLQCNTILMLYYEKK